LGAALSFAIGDFVGSGGGGVGKGLQLHKAGLKMGVLLLRQTSGMQLTQNRASSPRSGASSTPSEIFRSDVGARKRNTSHQDPDQDIIETHDGILPLIARFSILPFGHTRRG
jgi:hypothetical protein